MEGVLFVVSGPSGVGKGTLVKLILKSNPDVCLSVSCTTRKRRDNEIDGREYHFIEKDEFLKRLQEGDFFEYDEHFGNLYGTPKSFVEEQLKEKSVILEIDVNGALRAKELVKDTVLIMIVPPDLATLEKRLSGRGSETEKERSERIDRVRYELSMQEKYDYVIVNGNLRKAKRELQKIISQEIKNKKRRQNHD